MAVLGIAEKRSVFDGFEVERAVEVAEAAVVVSQAWVVARS
jgi:hypothetical protein